MLKEGNKAPEFELQDSYGKKVKLSNFKNKKVVLYFYPKDNTPGCTKEACSFRDNFNNYKKKDITILGVSKDNEKSHQNFISKFNLPFILLSDPEGIVCKLYGAYGKKKLYGREYEGIIRKTFLIDEKGNVKKIIEDVKCETHGEYILKLFSVCIQFI